MVIKNDDTTTAMLSAHAELQDGDKRLQDGQGPTGQRKSNKRKRSKKKIIKRSFDISNFEFHYIYYAK